MTTSDDPTGTTPRKGEPSRYRSARGVLAGATALALTLAGCAGSSAAAPTTSAAAATAATATGPGTAAPTGGVGPSGTTAPGATSSAPTALGQVVEVTVSGGRVTGPRDRVKVDQGSTVTLKVTSDVADEIHLHGYDKHVDVEKGGTATLTFKATLSGVFEAELESRGLQLVQLQVQ